MLTEGLQHRSTGLKNKQSFWQYPKFKTVGSKFNTDQEYTSHTCNTSQANNKQVFGNNQYTKQPKYEHNRITTLSGNQSTAQDFHESFLVI